MTIEFIDNRNSFFEDVKALGRKNSATLGFMPDGGFEDHARNKCIIIAHDGKTLAGYLMFRVVSRFSRNLWCYTTQGTRQYFTSLVHQTIKLQLRLQVRSLRRNKDYEDDKNRMDGQDVESHNGLHQKIGRLRTLLC